MAEYKDDDLRLVFGLGAAGTISRVGQFEWAGRKPCPPPSPLSVSFSCLFPGTVYCTLSTDRAVFARRLNRVEQ
eukprot:scaffold284188_cov26-Tisochrysis_lutea.AAC.3